MYFIINLYELKKYKLLIKKKNKEKSLFLVYEFKICGKSNCVRIFMRLFKMT